MLRSNISPSPISEKTYYPQDQPQDCKCRDVALQRLYVVARSVFRRTGTTDELAATVAGHIFCCNEAKRVRDMRKYPLRARGWHAALKRCSSPRPQRYCAIARPEGARPRNTLRYNDLQRQLRGHLYHLATRQKGYFPTLTERSSTWNELSGTWTERYRTWNKQFGTWNEQSGTWNERSGTWTEHSRTWTERPGTWNEQSGTWNVQSGTWNEQSGTWNEQSGTWNELSGTWNEQSGTWNEQSRTWNEQSGTWNEQSGTWNERSTTWTV